MSRARLIPILAAALLAITAPCLQAQGAESPAISGPGLRAEATERVQVSDPFLEFHTGPGRGYPVHFVAARGEWVTIELRRTDWYKLRAAGGQSGWVRRAQLTTTLAEGGERQTFPEVVLDDYLRRRFEAGAMLGRFQSEPLVRLWGAWRLADTVALEGAIGQVQGVYSGTSLSQLSVVSEPWSEQRLSPFLAVGLGRFHNLPNRSLVDARTTDVNMGLLALGLRWHLGQRFVARVDWTLYNALLGDSGYGEYRALSAGLSFFF